MKDYNKKMPPSKFADILPKSMEKVKFMRNYCKNYPNSTTF